MNPEIDLYFDPVDILESSNIKSEMTRTECAFLCGLLRAKGPHKIVEVGVAHGGTTCVILNCLKLMGQKAEIHSVDITDECYSTSGKETGYAVKEVFPDIPSNINYHMHLGDVLPVYLDEIGNNIDFLILDTMHRMPGEVLDFLAALPYLSDKAVVVVHDIFLNQITMNEFGYATKLLYDVVCADKIAATGVDTDLSWPNIGAFAINADTYKYIDDCFSSLTITWKYGLNEDMVKKYRDCYMKGYGETRVAVFDRTVTMNHTRLQEEKNRNERYKNTVQNFHEIISSGRKLLFYGAGDFADKLASYVSLLGYKIEAFVVSDDKSTDTRNRLGKVYKISELPYVKRDCCLIIAMSIEKHCQIQGVLKSKEFHSIFPSEDDDYQRLINYVDDYMAIRCFSRERLYEDTFCSK